MAGYGQLGRKIGTSIGSFFSPDARQQGEMAGLQQIALQDQIEQGRAKAEADRQALALKQQEAQLKTPEASRNRIMQAFQIPTDNAPDIDAHQRTGRMDRFNIGDLQGPVMPTPDWATKENLGKFGRMFAADQAVQAGSAKDMNDALKAPGVDAEADLIAQTASGQLPAGEAVKRFFALKGGNLFESKEYGVMDNLTGLLNTTQAAPLYVQGKQAEIDLRGAQTGAAKANAVQSYAQAREAGNKPGTYDADRGVIVDPRTGQARAVTIDGQPLAPKPGKGGGKLPAAALKMQQEEVDAINTADAVDQALAVVDKRITDGKLKLGPVANILSRGQNAAGASTENSKNFASLQSSLEKLRNDTLRLNKGVQTEGDAARAWNELVTSLNDPELVRQRIAEIRQINTRAKTLRQNNIDLIRSNYGADAYDHEARIGGATGEWKIERVP